MDDWPTLEEARSDEGHRETLLMRWASELRTRVMRNHQAIQETLAKALLWLDHPGLNLPFERAPLAYLTRVLANEFKDEQRRKNLPRRRAEATYLRAGRHRDLSQVEVVQAMVDLPSQIEALRRAFERLNDWDREALRLRYWEGLTTEQACGQLEPLSGQKLPSIGSVGGRVKKARLRLFKTYVEMGGSIEYTRFPLKSARPAWARMLWDPKSLLREVSELAAKE